MGFIDLTSESQPIALNFLNLELAEQRVGAIDLIHQHPIPQPLTQPENFSLPKL